MAFVINHTLSISITEDDLKRLIIDEIQRQDPTIVVDDITFTQKRNPTSIETAVSAHVETGNTQSVHRNVVDKGTPEEAQNVVEEVTKKSTKKPKSAKTPAEEFLEAEDDLTAVPQDEIEEEEESIEDLLSNSSEDEAEEDDPFL